MQMVKINKISYTTQPPPTTVSRFSLTFIHGGLRLFLDMATIDQTTKLRVIRKSIYL